MAANPAEDLSAPDPDQVAKRLQAIEVNEEGSQNITAPKDALAVFKALTAEQQADFLAEITGTEDLFDFEDLEDDQLELEEDLELEDDAPEKSPQMKWEINEVADLAAPFREVRDAASLAQVLNAALPWHLKRHPTASVKPITIRSLNYYAYKKQASRYRTFHIAKRAKGEKREIKAPEEGLLRVQRLLLLCMAAVFGPGDDAAHGFVLGRSVLTNAKPHVGRRFVLNLDLKDFFPRTHFGKVVAVLQLPPFKLNKEGAYLIANLCCDQGALPQGAPTSPILTNVVCQRLDRKLGQLASQFRCEYTRYADDLTFSSNRHVFGKKFHNALNDILAKDGYEQNLKKQRLQTPEMRQEVTGVVVNDKPNAPREYVRQIRAMLHNWDKYGYDVAAAKLRASYGESKAGSRHKGHVPKLERVVAGKIAYLGMVRGTDDPTYLQFAHRMALLVNEDYKQTSVLLELLRRTEEFL